MSTVIKTQSTIYTPPLKNLAIHTEKFEICETVQLLPKAITGKIMFKGCLCIRLPRFYLDRKVFLVLSSQVKSDDIPFAVKLDMLITT